MNIHKYENLCTEYYLFNTFTELFWITKKNHGSPDVSASSSHEKKKKKNPSKFYQWFTMNKLIVLFISLLSSADT